MTTRQKIRNPEAYAKAARRREIRRQQLIDGIAHRISPIVRRKFSGVLTAPSVMMVWDILAQQGGIDPDMKRIARRLGFNLQDAMQEALNVAVERGDISMSYSDCGEIMLFIWPPMGLEEISEVFGDEEFAEAWPTIMFLGLFFADGVL